MNFVFNSRSHGGADWSSGKILCFLKLQTTSWHRHSWKEVDMYQQHVEGTGLHVTLYSLVIKVRKVLKWNYTAPPRGVAHSHFSKVCEMNFRWRDKGWILVFNLETNLFSLSGQFNTLANFGCSGLWWGTVHWHLNYHYSTLPVLTIENVQFYIPD